MFKFLFYITLTVFISSCQMDSAKASLEENNKPEEVQNLLLHKDILNESKEKSIDLFDGYQDKLYSYSLKKENDMRGEAFYVYEGELPKGLELNEKTGVILGEPKESGVFKIKIAIKDMEEENLIIIPANLSINENIDFFKDVRSFIDISKSDKSGTVSHNQVIPISSNPAKDFFNFYNEGISEIKVCQQGYLKLGTGNCSLTSDVQNKRIIAPFADPELVLGSDSQIHYQVRGSQPRRMLIIQFKNLHRVSDPLASQNFEVIIYEDTNRISFIYGLSHSNIDSTRKHLGTNAIVGLSFDEAQKTIIAPLNQEKPKPQIFNGTVITFNHNPTSNTYQKTLDSNIVTDFIDISRYLEETETCTSNAQCRLTDKCFQGKCASYLLTNKLMYDGVAKVKLPFYFNFYGSSFDEVNVQENGYLFFGAENYNFYSTVPKRGAAKPVSDIDLNYVIAGMYSDIDLKSTRGGNILYNVVGQEPNRKAVFLYDKVRLRNNGDGETHICTFEMILHEGSNIIEVLYGTNNKSPLCNGQVSSVGLKKNSSDYASISSSNSVLKQGKSITFVPNDLIASSYTWVGIGNEIRNSVYIDGANGKFTQVPAQWTLIDDLPPTNFIRYDQTIDNTIDRWINTDDAQKVYLGDDSHTTLTASGTSFKLYGLERTVFYIQSNGGLTIDSNTINFNEPADFNYAPSSGTPDTGIFPYWDDLNPSKGGDIRYGVYTRGGNPEKIMVVEWNNIPRYPNKGNIVMQIQMYENGQKYLCYKDLTLGNGNSKHLTGIRNNRNDYLQYQANVADLVTTNKCIAYTPVYMYPPNHVVGIRSSVSDDNLGSGEEKVSIGFNFDFAGSNFNEITLSSNGIAILGDATASNISGDNKELSNNNTPNNSLALFWDDLNPKLNTTSGSGVFYNTIGVAPNRTFILSYNSTPHQNAASTKINAQILLTEGKQEILYCYDYLGGAYHSGDSATVGIKIDNSKYTQLLYKQGNLNSNTCYLWTPPTTGFVEARNIYQKESNADFVDLPVENPDPNSDGNYLDPLYLDTSDNLNKPYKIYDLEEQNYSFDFKGKSYNQLFVDANGAVSFGNDNDAAIVTAPLWGDVFYQEDITNKSHISLQSQYENVENDFMWIANSKGNSLSKINTHNGTVDGPFAVGSSPSRTAVGFDGSVWVGNRNSHNVTKLDREGNLICTVNLASNCSPRGLALDKDENLWVGCGAWRGSAPDGWVYKVKDHHNELGERCEILDIRSAGDNSSDLSFKRHVNYGHYGFALDRRGILWSSPGTHGSNHSYFLRVDTNKTQNEPGFYKKFRGYSNNSRSDGNGGYVSRANQTGNDGTPYYYYGIAIDLNGDLWLGNWGNTNSNRAITKAHYDENSDTLTFKTFPSYQNRNVSHARGVAIDINQNIYVAYSTTNNVGKYAPDGTALNLFALNTNTGPEGAHHCTGPSGIGVDGDGDIWANCISSSKSEELNPNTGEELKSLPTGDTPYCYSDNTGFNLRNIVSEIKPAKYYAKVIEKIVSDNHGNEMCARILVVEWRNVRMITHDNYGYTEASFEMIFDNGHKYDVGFSNGRKVCDTSKQPIATPSVSIKYLYGAMQGNKYSQKTGGQSIITMKSLYSNYNHTFGDNDSGTINSGSKLVITSKK